MTEKDLLLAIDNGTQSLKAMVFDITGNLVDREQIPLSPYFAKQPGWAEQDPDLFWKTLCQACQRIMTGSSVESSRIAAVSVTTQRGTVINVDKTGAPLRPAILWLDQRRCQELPPLGGWWNLLFKITGLKKTVTTLQRQAEANWIIQNQPEIWKKTHKYLLLSGYLNFRLTGEYSDSIGSQVGYLPFDYKRHQWARPSSWKWGCVPVEPDQLPKLVAPGQLLGTVTQQASKETGLPKDLPVFAAAADKACEVVGSGGMDPSIGCLSFGTTATININHHRYIEPIRLVPAYPSAIPGHFTLEVQVFRGFWMVNWFKHEFGYKEQQAAKKTDTTTEALFEKMIADIPPGSMGLMLQPYWTPGIRKPGPEAKGAIIGFSDVHTRAHLYRSILEGLAYALREGKERIEHRSRIPITRLRVSGGGSQSDQALQITADIFGLPVERPHLYDTSGLGAAIDCAVGAGLHCNFQTAIAGMTRAGEEFEPNLANHHRYNMLYREVYRKMYRRMKPLYRKIREMKWIPEK